MTNLQQTDPEPNTRPTPQMTFFRREFWNKAITPEKRDHECHGK